MKEYVLLSGGPDSSTLVHELSRSREITCLYINFGQPYLERELASARMITKRLKIPLEEIIVPSIGHYFVGLGEYGHVILREIIEISYGMASAYARFHGGKVLYHANIAEDVDDIPGLAEFFPTLQHAINLMPGGQDFRIESPYILVRKAEVFERACELNVPLDLTWSCLRPGETHCGTCRSCRRRMQAFSGADIPDITQYATKLIK